MKRTFLLVAATLASSAVTVPLASAMTKPVELGPEPGAAVSVASCPGVTNLKFCDIVMTHVTALQTVRNGVGYPTKVKTAGRIVAFTVGLSGLSPNRSTAHTIIHNLDNAWGGTTHVAITVLQPVGRPGRHRWKDVAQSPYIHVQPFLGQVVTLPLVTSLPVQPGDVIALTTDTWAAVLTTGQSTKAYFYRQSRSTACNRLPTTQYAQTVGQAASYGCPFIGTRPEYSATEILDPVAINPIRGVFRGTATPRGVGDRGAFGSSTSGGAGL